MKSTWGWPCFAFLKNYYPLRIFLERSSSPKEETTCGTSMSCCLHNSSMQGAVNKLLFFFLFHRGGWGPYSRTHLTEEVSLQEQAQHPPAGSRCKLLSHGRFSWSAAESWKAAPSSEDEPGAGTEGWGPWSDPWGPRTRPPGWTRRFLLRCRRLVLCQHPSALGRRQHLLLQVRTCLGTGTRSVSCYDLWLYPRGNVITGKYLR